MSDQSAQPTTASLPPQPWKEKITADRFRNKTVIITGAGAGIGRATALRVAREGGRVIAADISAERLAALTKEFPELGFITVAGDVSKQSDVAAIVDAAGKAIDGLANIAGIMDDFTPVHEVSDDVWERVFRINVTGTMLLTRAVTARMLAAKSGSVVNTTSEAGLRGSAAGVAYTASKHAVVGLTLNSAVMYGPQGLRFNAVAPGPVKTSIEANFNSELGATRLGPLMQANLPAPAHADQLAASITFLLSDDATNLNGAILPSDGGWSAL